MSKTKIIGLGVFVSLAIAFVAVGSPVKALGDIFTVSRDASLKEVVMELQDVADILQPAQQEESLGAVSSPDMPYNYIGVGGMRKQRFAGAVTQATTTICSFNPDFGTTTLRAFGVEFDIASSSATRVTIGKGTNTNSTSTPFWEAAVAGSAQANVHVVATTTVNGLNQPHTIAPGETVQITLAGGDQGGSYTGLVPEGTCFAEFDVH